MHNHIDILYYFPPIGVLYRYGYKVGHIKRDDQGVGFLTLNYRDRKLDRPVESLSPALIENIVEMFCAGLDGLDGALTASTWRKTVVINEPGAYANISESDYNADPCDEISLRSSIAWKLVERGSTPRHAWFASPRLNPNFKPENRRMFDLGRACHAMLLGRGAEYAIIHHDSFRTKAAQEMRAAAYENGKIPLLSYEAQQVKDMAKAAREQLKALVDAGTMERMPFGQGETEVTLIWRDRGVLCRARLDYLPKDGEALYEYKTTNASAAPEVWQFRQFRQLGYDHQLAFYRRGLEALGIATSPHFSCVVQETFEPYLLSFVRVDDEVIMRADEKVQQALKIWARCLKTNEWPGYSTAGYDIELTERERQQEMAARPQEAHVFSDDIPDSAYSPPTFPGRK